MPGLPPAAAVPLVCIAGFLAGGAWAAIPAILKTKYKVDDVVTSLLLNYVMWHIMGYLLFGPLQMPGSSWPRSPAIAEAARFPVLLARSRFHLGIVLAAAAVLIVWFINSKTVFGYQARAVGVNPRAAAFGGINVNSVILKTALISGGLAGMAGVRKPQPSTSISSWTYRRDSDTRGSPSPCLDASIPWEQPCRRFSSA